MAEIVPISGYNDRVELHKSLPLETPFTLNIFPTNACNFRCVYCAQSLGSKAMRAQYGFDTSQRMSLETFQRIVEQSQHFKRSYKLLSFMGHGEPLLHKELPKMVAMAHRAGIAERIEIITNGSLLTPELSDTLLEAGITNIRISLQGLSAAMYMRTSRVHIDFERFMSNLMYFHKAGQSQASRLYVKILDLSLDDGDEKRFYDVFDGMCSRMYVEKAKPVYAGVEATDSVTDLTTDRYGNYHPPRLVCPLAFFSLAVWPNGDIAPCDAIYKPVCVGNIHHTSLSEAFAGRKVNAFRSKLLEGKKNDIPGCVQCCAPDDVSHEKDTLDAYAGTLKSLYSI